MEMEMKIQQKNQKFQKVKRENRMKMKTKR